MWQEEMKAGAAPRNGPATAVATIRQLGDAQQRKLALCTTQTAAVDIGFFLFFTVYNSSTQSEVAVGAVGVQAAPPRPFTPTTRRTFPARRVGVSRT